MKREMANLLVLMSDVQVPRRGMATRRSLIAHRIDDIKPMTEKQAFGVESIARLEQVRDEHCECGGQQTSSACQSRPDGIFGKARGGSHQMVTINLTNIVSVMPPAMMIPIQKKSQNKIHYACGSGGTWACGVRFLRLHS
jgi:hypothetical protein